MNPQEVILMEVNDDERNWIGMELNFIRHLKIYIALKLEHNERKEEGMVSGVKLKLESYSVCGVKIIGNKETLSRELNQLYECEIRKCIKFWSIIFTSKFKSDQVKKSKKLDMKSNLLI